MRHGNQDEHNRILIYRKLLADEGRVVFKVRSLPNRQNVGIVIECPDDEFPIFSQYSHPYFSFVLTPEHTYFESHLNLDDAVGWLGSTFGEGQFIPNVAAI